MVRSANTFQVRIQSEAMDDLDRIYRFIFADSPSRARRFIKNLKNKILNLQKFPLRGSRARILDPAGSNLEIRFIEYQAYLVFYTVEGKLVTILHIAAPNRDWQALFSLLA